MSETSGKGQLNFHYNREERLAMAPQLRKPPSGKRAWFKANRNVIILFINVVAVMVLIAVVYPRLMARSATIRMDGYSIGLRAFRYDGTIFISLKVGAGEKEHESPSGGPFMLRLRIGDEVLTRQGTLPAYGSETVIRETVPDRAGIAEASAEVAFGGAERTITVKIKDAEN